MMRRAVRDGKKFLNPIETAVGSWRTMLRVAFLYFTNQAERTPKTPLGPFRTDAKVYASAPASGLRVTWFGHSSMLVEIDGVRVLVDPMWDERASPVNWGGPRRFFAAPLKLEDLPKIDVVLISHDHYDHLGARTVKALARLESAREARWVTSLGVGAELASFGVTADRVTELDWTETAQVGNLAITSLPSRHFSGRSLANRFQTLWGSFVLAGPEHRVYYGADSGEWPGFAEIGREYGPFDLTMLEIGAYDPLWADIHMGPDGALRSFEAMGKTGLLMPIHWGLFDLALHAWRQPIERIFSFGDLKLWAPVPGVPTDVVSGGELRSRWWV